MSEFKSRSVENASPSIVLKIICPVTRATLTFAYIVRTGFFTDPRFRRCDRSERGRFNNERTRPLPVSFFGQVFFMPLF